MMTGSGHLQSQLPVLVTVMFLQFLTSESHLRKKVRLQHKKKAPKWVPNRWTKKQPKTEKQARAPVPSSVQPGKKFGTQTGSQPQTSASPLGGAREQ